MADNVVKLNKDTIAELRKRKLLREKEEAIELDPVGPGETMIGVLTDEERTLFIEIATLRQELDDQHKEYQARSMEMVAAAIRKSAKPENIVQNLDDTVVFPNEDDAKTFYAIEDQFQYLQAMFNSSIRARHGAHCVYGVRSDYTIVRVAYKYKLAEELRRMHYG